MDKRKRNLNPQEREGVAAMFYLVETCKQFDAKIFVISNDDGAGFRINSPAGSITLVLPFSENPRRWAYELAKAGDDIRGMNMALNSMKVFAAKQNIFFKNPITIPGGDLFGENYDFPKHSMLN